MNAIAPLRISVPGLYRMRAPDYHADPAIVASLSHSIAKLMLKKSALHGWAAHPRLNHKRKMKAPTEAMDRGSILHSMILGTGSEYHVLDFPHYRTDRAKEAKAYLRARGIIPLLRHKEAEFLEIAAAVKKQIKEHPQCEEFFSEGAESELALLWQEGPVWCRALVDRLPSRPGAPFYDLKSTGMDASPKAFARVIERDHATGAAFYLRGGRAMFELEKLDLPPSDYRFIAFEIEDPFAISVHALAPEKIQAMEEEIFKAVVIFSTGLITGKWPGYSTDLHLVTPNPWDMKAAIEAEPEEPTVYTEIDDLLVEERLAA